MYFPTEKSGVFRTDPFFHFSRYIFVWKNNCAARQSGKSRGGRGVDRTKDALCCIWWCFQSGRNVLLYDEMHLLSVHVQYAVHVLVPFSPSGCAIRFLSRSENFHHFCRLSDRWQLCPPPLSLLSGDFTKKKSLANNCFLWCDENIHVGSASLTRVKNCKCQERKRGKKSIWVLEEVKTAAFKVQIKREAVLTTIMDPWSHKNCPTISWTFI